MTLRVVLENGNKAVNVRALIDTGSQLSYSSTRIIKELKWILKRKQHLEQSLFGGGGNIEPRLHEAHKIKISNLNGNFSVDIEVMSEERICSYVPKTRALLTLREWEENKTVISDLYSKDYVTDLLIGANVAGQIMTGNSVQLSSGIIVLETRLGHTLISTENLSGSLVPTTKVIEGDRYNNMHVISLHLMNSAVDRL
ncbi:hypothetical protein HNY73_019101 [Argiope bruennichi]|uniref:Peptidase aspartic putative domain-containing protein n=1 Tax=Argiope bruennichi TaxID=94029 RepID=A0A8T0EFM8_ARGBR|nr:hypothetical protein HNY73_019101 [Argiope bruennichi]